MEILADIGKKFEKPRAIKIQLWGFWLGISKHFGLSLNLRVGEGGNFDPRKRHGDSWRFRRFLKILRFWTKIATASVA